MPQIATVVASGPGWRVSDVVCTDGPKDRRFAEQHDGVCIAMVLAGHFQYRGSGGEALLAPGMVLTGNAGHGFECGHDHGIGDRCLSFSYDAEFAEAVVGEVSGARRLAFDAPALPPSPRLVPLIARALADPGALEEIAVQLAGYAVAARRGARALTATAREQRIVAETLTLIEAGRDDPGGKALSLAALSRRSGIGPYRYLRLFRRLTGMTPHQYLLHRRLERTAARLLAGDEEISAIAFAAGFNDLSSFNRRFRRLLGQTPSAFRAARGKQ